ncbi:MAG: ATP-binding cassette domain-containing protein [Solirubrobacteraceae bacterium]|nr:ATP-binding cassette domain-containing protein [Solirubrobacteraceae bacterium]
MSEERGIDVQGLVREFKGGVRAVDGIDLHVDAGEIYGFLGPNGAGKSTTVKVLTTLLPPSAGQATVAGHDVAREGAKVRAAIGVALQDVALDPMLTGREHMRLQGGLQGIPRAERGKRGDELLERVGLTDAADRKSKTYSGGMKRRLDLALALLHNPRILFLDEPTTGLDVQSRTALWEEVERLARQEGTTVFLTTQYLEEADVLADRVGIIDRGTIVAEGTPAQLKAQVAKPTVELVPRDSGQCAAAGAALEPFGELISARQAGSIAVRLDSGADQLAAIVRALDQADIAFANLALHEPTLDDVFLAKTGRSLEGAADGPGDGEVPPAPGRSRGEPAVTTS